MALKDPKEWKIAGKPVKRLDTAIEVAPRYININTGAVTETEVEFAQRLVESARQC